MKILINLVDGINLLDLQSRELQNYNILKEMSLLAQGLFW